MRANVTLHPSSLAAALIAGSLFAAPVAAGQDEGSSEERAAGAPAARVAILGPVEYFQLEDDKGNPFASDALEGFVWIASSFCTRCEPCSRQVAALIDLQAELADHPSVRDVRLVSLSLDPGHDKPGALRSYKEDLGAHPRRWIFLTGKRPEVRKARRGLGLSAKEDEEADNEHGAELLLVDRALRMRGRYDALDEGALARLRADLELVLEDPPGPITAARPEYFDDESPGPRVHVPLEARDVPWMKERAAMQAKSLDRFRVYHDFRFVDRLPASGITFVNRVVDDATRDYKAVHYDHGNGVPIADVDGDGRLDVYFVTQLGSNRLYRNAGGGKFVDTTEAAGVGVADRISVTASFADIDNDGDADLYVTTVRGGNVLFENDGKGVFADVTEGSGLDQSGHFSSPVFFDFDRDGLLDVFLTNVGEYTTDKTGDGGYYVGHPDAFTGQIKPGRAKRSFLMKNAGENKFVDVSKDVGLVDKSWTGAASPLDLNEDGWLDLYVLNMQGHDEYYENVGGTRFVAKSRKVFPLTPWGSMGIKVFDFDNDGRMDIYVTDMHTDMIDDTLTARRYWYAEKLKMSRNYPLAVLNTDGKHVLGNAFFHNLGSGTFREESDDLGAENYWPWGLSVGDLNADGFEDVFVTSSMNYPFRYGVNSVLLNDRGAGFLDSEFILGVEPRRDGRTSTLWFTLDCDGADEKHGLCAEREGTLEVWAALGTRSSAIFDIEGDGDLDIVTNDFNSEPMVLVSDLSERKPDLQYLAIQLVGEKTNRDGLGTRVEVEAGGQRYVKVHDGISGYLSQSSYPLYFGLGAAGEVERVTVKWAAGGTQVVEGPIETRQLLTITEE